MNTELIWTINIALWIFLFITIPLTSVAANMTLGILSLIVRLLRAILRMFRAIGRGIVNLFMPRK